MEEDIEVDIVVTMGKEVTISMVIIELVVGVIMGNFRILGQ